MPVKKSAEDKKRPLNLTINRGIYELAERIKVLRLHSSISTLVEELIRDEYEKRCGLMVFPTSRPSPPTPNTSKVKGGAKPDGVSEKIGGIAAASQETAEADSMAKAQGHSRSPKAALPNDSKPEPTPDAQKV